jgi:hypothetical protein
LNIFHVLPTELEVKFVDRLKDVFGIEGTRAVLRLIWAVIMRRLHGILTWANWYLTKLDIAGLKVRVNSSRYFGDLVYEINIRVMVEDIDPILIRKHLKVLYKMAKIDKDQERVTRELEEIVAKFMKEDLLEEAELQAEVSKG